MAVSVALIYMALVLQFKNAVKPLLVFAAIPYGMAGAFVALAVMGQPFGFMAFLGVASLVGVIVSHVIVLFDFIEEAHHEGEPLREALLDAGIVRLRPVMITVGATVLGLVPLAMHGGPLWEPLCYAQIGGSHARHVHHAAARSGHVFDLRPGSQADPLGKGGRRRSRDRPRRGGFRDGYRELTLSSYRELTSID